MTPEEYAKKLTLGGGGFLPDDSPIIGQLTKKYQEAPSYTTQDLSRENPLPWQTYLPNELGYGNDSLAAKIWGRGLDPEYAKNELTKGVGSDSVGLISNPLGSRGGSAMGSAISSRYNAEAGDKLASLKTKADVNQESLQSKELARAADIFGKDQAIAMSNFKEQKAWQDQRVQLYNQWQNAKSQAEASMWGQILGSIPVIGGLAAGALKGGGSQTTMATPGDSVTA